MSAWSNRAPVWCELVCDNCNTTEAGRWVHTNVIPRGAMIKAATQRGWLFAGLAMWCSEKCKAEQEKVLSDEGQNHLDKPTMGS